MSRIGVIFAVILLLSVSICIAEENLDEPINESVVRVYIDCRYCDMDYFRTEIGLATLVRDRKQADVHIIISQQETATGGIDHTIELIGLNNFESMIDTVHYFSKIDDTDDTTRKGLTRKIKMSLVRYALKTDANKDIEVTYNKPAIETEIETDKWKNWTFSIELQSYFNGQKSYRSIHINGDVSAQKVTEMNRFEVDFWGNYNENKFDYDDLKSLNISRSKGGNILYFKGLDDHWSIGVSGSVYSSTYSNKKLSTSFSARSEYNVFNYNESTRRQLRLGYSISASIVDYEEITIYDKSEENLYSQGASISLKLIQPWGSVSTSISGSHYLHDFDKNWLGIYGNVSLRLVEGLSLSLNGNVSRVRNQLALCRGDASEEDVLLRQKELATSYNYWANIGINYTFGSSNNNIVNPRFGY